MGVRVLVGEYDGGESAACMVDSVTGTAFGPLFRGEDAVEDIDRFVRWLSLRHGWDPRELTSAQLEDAHACWAKEEAKADEDEDAALADTVPAGEVSPS